MSKSEKLVEVYKARTEMEAQVIKSLLDSFGIPCSFKSNAAPSAHMFTMNGMAEVKVMVLESQAENARELIENKEPETESSSYPTSTEEDERTG